MWKKGGNLVVGELIKNHLQCVQYIWMICICALLCNSWLWMWWESSVQFCIDLCTSFPDAYSCAAILTWYSSHHTMFSFGICIHFVVHKWILTANKKTLWLCNFSREIGNFENSLMQGAWKQFYFNFVLKVNCIFTIGLLDF